MARRRKMTPRVALAASLLLAVAMPSRGGDTLLEAQPIEDERLVRILANAEMRRLPADENIVRLYGIPEQGDCNPETHWVCSHDYYVAISAYGEAPDQSVYRIGRVGEITEAVALPRVPGVQDRLRITSINYPAEVLARMPGLERVERHFELRINESRLEIRPSE
jgi:hypothetical protein